MLRLSQIRFATFVLFVVAVLSLSAASARAFSQQNFGTGGDGNSTFADSDDRVSKFGRGAQPFGQNGPTVQFGAQRGPLTPFGHFQGSGFNSGAMPDPYSRQLGNGN